MMLLKLCSFGYIFKTWKPPLCVQTFSKLTKKLLAVIIYFYFFTAPIYWTVLGETIPDARSTSGSRSRIWSTTKNFRKVSSGRHKIQSRYLSKSVIILLDCCEDIDDTIVSHLVFYIKSHFCRTVVDLLVISIMDHQSS